MTNWKKLLNVLIMICFGLAIVSYFLPHLEKINFRMAYLVEYPFIIGNEFFFAKASFILIGYSSFLLFYRKGLWSPFALSIGNLLAVLLLRYSIHYSGYRGLDHDFETKTAYGYHFLVLVSLLHFGICAVYLIMHQKINKTDASI